MPEYFFANLAIIHHKLMNLQSGKLDLENGFTVWHTHCSISHQTHPQQHPRVNNFAITTKENDMTTAAQAIDQMTVKALKALEEFKGFHPGTG